MQKILTTRLKGISEHQDQAWSALEYYEESGDSSLLLNRCPTCPPVCRTIFISSPVAPDDYLGYITGPVKHNGICYRIVTALNTGREVTTQVDEFLGGDGKFYLGLRIEIEFK